MLRWTTEYLPLLTVEVGGVELFSEWNLRFVLQEKQEYIMIEDNLKKDLMDYYVFAKVNIKKIIDVFNIVSGSGKIEDMYKHLEKQGSEDEYDMFVKDIYDELIKKKEFCSYVKGEKKRANCMYVFRGKSMLHVIIPVVVAYYNNMATRYKIDIPRPKVERKEILVAKYNKEKYVEVNNYEGDEEFMFVRDIVLAWIKQVVSNMKLINIGYRNPLVDIVGDIVSSSRGIKIEKKRKWNYVYIIAEECCGRVTYPLFDEESLSLLVRLAGL